MRRASHLGDQMTSRVLCERFTVFSQVLRGHQEKSDLEWLAQVLPYIDRLKGHPLVVVDYDLQMEDPVRQLYRIATGQDLDVDASIETSIHSYAEGFATNYLCHHRYDPAALQEREELNPITVDTYLWLHRLATDKVRADDQELWSALAELQQRFQDMAPVLGYVDFLEDEVKQRYFGLAGIWRKIQPRIGSGGKKSADQLR